MQNSKDLFACKVCLLKKKTTYSQIRPKESNLNFCDLEQKERGTPTNENENAEFKFIAKSTYSTESFVTF